MSHVSGHALFCGVNHRTAPLEIRERLALAPSTTAERLSALRGHATWREAALLSTCNRTELYLVADQPMDASAALEVLQVLTGVGQLSRGHVVAAADAAAARHLMRVASGLDSQVIGEHQIVGQVRQAQVLAREAGTLGPILDRFFNTAVHASARVHTETRIGWGAVSVASAGIALAEQELGSLAGRRALVVGAGETGTLAARHLAKRALGALAITNRTPERAHAAAALVHADVVAWESWAERLADVDLVVFATDAGRHVATAGMIGAVIGDRLSPLVLIDLSMPRNVDPAAADLPGVTVHALDDLSALVAASHARRCDEMAPAEQIIEQEAVTLANWLRGRAAAPLVRELHAHFERVRSEEVARSLKHLGPDERSHIEDVTRALVHKLLQAPTVRLTSVDPMTTPGVCWAEAVRDLFALEGRKRQAARG